MHILCVTIAVLPQGFLTIIAELLAQKLVLIILFSFQGISPKLEYCCSTTVSDVATPTSVRYSELVHQLSDEDEDDDIITIKPGRRSSRRRYV